MTTFKSGDVIVGRMSGAVESKNRPAVVLSSDTYHANRPDIIVGFITSNTVASITPTDHQLIDWQDAGLRKPSAFRSFIVTLQATDCRIVGRLSAKDWKAVQKVLNVAFRID